MNTKNKDIRWLQRFANYEKAFRELDIEVEDAIIGEMSNLEKKGVIKSFEIVYELSWNVLKDFLEEQGNSDIRGSKDAFRQSLNANLLSKNAVTALLDSVEDRHKTTHTYDADEMDKIFHHILESYHLAFGEVYTVLNKEKQKI